MRAAGRRVLVLDHTKFARRALHSFAALTDFDVVVVDAATPQAVRDELAAEGVQVLVSEL